MPPGGIALDKAELLSVLLEALLYGFSLLMFGATIWQLVFRQSTRRVNRGMFIVACLLLLGSTTHLVINIIRVMQGLILYRDATPGGPLAYFAHISQWTFVAKSYVFTAQTLIGDGVVIYRCYKVWKSKLVMILPVLLWCSTVVTGIGTPYVLSRVTQKGVFGGALGTWITSFWVTALSTNLLTTLLLVSRIWYIDRKEKRLRGRRSQLRPVLRTIIDAGAIYSITLIVALTCFITRSNAQYIVLDLVTPIISITFYMVIIRVGLAVRPIQTLFTSGMALGSASVNHTSDAGQKWGTQVHVTTLTETQVHDAGHSRSPISSSEHPWNGIKSDGAVDIIAI